MRPPFVRAALTQLTAGALLVLATIGQAAPFTPGNLVVVRAGDGAAALSSASAAVFLDEITPAGGLVQSIALPTAANGSNARFTLAGTATSEGGLERSGNGQFFSLAGYDAAPGTAGVAATTAATVNRTIARVDGAGAVDTSTRLSDGFSGGNFRSAVSDDGTRFWAAGTSSPAGSGGVRFIDFGTAGNSTQVAASPNNARIVRIFGGQLYVSSASSPAVGINSVGNGLPTGSGTTNALTVPSASGSTSPYAYVFFDRDPNVAGFDTVYVADSGAGLQKYSLTGSAWTARGSIPASGLFGLTGALNSNNQVELYGTTPSSLLKFVDAGASTDPLSGSASTVSAAGSNRAYRGVAFAPSSGTTSTPPSGSGSATPNTLMVNETTLLALAVTPGTNPASTNILVRGNLSAIGGSATQPFFDDGTNGDVTANDGVYSFLGTVTSGSGMVLLPITITDAEARTGNTSIALTITGPVSLSPISSIQGQTDASLTGTFAVQGIVTAVLPNLSPSGFFVEEEATDVDSDPLTSEGIFVAASSLPQVGQTVRVQGTVTNNFGLTQFSAGASVSVQPASGALAAAASGQLPGEANATAYLERFEGMRVVFPDQLFVTETFDLGRFGEVDLAADSRLFNPTNSIDPNDNPPSGTTTSGSSNVAAVAARAALNNRSRFVLDDNSNTSNPNPIPYLRTASVGGGRTLRVGDSVTGLTGVLSFGFGTYRLQPTAEVTFTESNPRTVVPAATGGNVRVASFNVLNYFITFGGPNDRGADNVAELNRQRAKIVAALRAIDADVVGLIEMQNNGSGPGSAIHDLLNHPNGLNAAQTAAGQDVYTTLPLPSEPFGSDAIKVAFIYKATRVTPQGPSLTDTANPTVHNRPPLAQLFSVNSTGGSFYACVNHFKSKSAGGATGADLDQMDGQGAYNARRKLQASALISFLSGLAQNDPDILVLGDLNAYAEEDPIDLFRAAGYIDVLGASAGKSDPYSFVFFGEAGRLDHALTTPGFVGDVTGVTVWHINSDEPNVIDYNLPRADDPYLANPYRSSDHDPLIVGMSVNAPQALSAVSRKTHGSAGTFDVVLPLSGPAGIESRRGAGANQDEHQIVVRFANPVTVGSASTTDGAGSVNSFSVVGSEVTINLAGVANAQRLVVTLSNVNDGVNSGNVSIPLALLLGDVTGNGATNASDVGSTKSQAGTAVNQFNFRADVTASGEINATDISLVKANAGQQLP